MSETSEQSSIKSVTVMLLAVNFVYLFCLSPLQILFLIYHDVTIKGEDELTTKAEAVEGLLWSITFFLEYINHYKFPFVYVVWTTV